MITPNGHSKRTDEQFPYFSINFNFAMLGYKCMICKKVAFNKPDLDKLKVKWYYFKLNNLNYFIFTKPTNKNGINLN